ncbi:MAG TPA: hypothetical protein VGD08_22040 [Stellaceae bacterium]|jgi:hypothetical protein
MKRLIAIAGAVVATAAFGGWMLHAHDADGSKTARTASDWIPKVKAEARGWKPDAELVAIEFFNFGFAVDPTTHFPDMTKSGPPAAIMYSFYSKSAKDGVRVSVNVQDLPEEQRKLMEQRGWKPMQFDHFQAPWSPYTLPIPEDVDLDYQKAIDAARKDIAEQCQGQHQYGNCELMSGLELHMFWNGQGDRTGHPVWTVKFGQDPLTLETVEREVDGATGQVVAFDPRKKGDEQAKLFEGEPTKLHNVSVTLSEPGFQGLWRGVNAAVRQQDPLYKPYAVSLAANVSVQKPDDTVRLGEMYVQYVRQTPSLVWEDMTVHVEGRGKTLNVIFETPERHSAPIQPIPTALEADKLPNADNILKMLAGIFPKAYHEIYYSDYQGCQSTTFGNVTRQECGVWMQQEHRTDVVFFWLTRQGNPWWNAKENPIDSELKMVSDAVPEGGWVWWTRIKQGDVWKYTIVDAETGRQLPNVCTNPNSGQNTIRSQPC